MITSFTANPPAIYNEQNDWFNVTAQGGAPPYTFWYRGLPPGCASANNSSLFCRPKSSQHYLVEVTVNDTLGAQANATTNLTVTSGFGPAPEITSFTATPATVAVGKLTYLVVVAQSRSGTPNFLLSYAFIGLPPGCATFNQTNLSCIPTTPGTYQVWVRVTDSYSQANQTFLFLNVTGTGPTGKSGSSTPTGPWIELVAVGVVVVIAVVGALVYLPSRRKRPPKPPVSTPATPTDPANQGPKP